METEYQGVKMADSPKLSLDLKGLLCPMPVVKIAQAMKQVQVGELVEAVATDAGVMADMPAWARTSGNELVELEKREKDFRFVVRRVK
jgi:tRNA 2-thiouridine synthesizing protein A